jgi:hypothetical protein
MLNMKVDPEMYMKTKDQVTICPTQKATFLPGCTPFYAKAHVFCGNRQLFCHYLSLGERTPRFKMWKLETRQDARATVVGRGREVRYYNGLG